MQSIAGQEKWDLFFLGLAKYMAGASKDPSTKVGAVITRPNRSVAGVGFNGFPIGVEDTLERLNNRELKYKIVVHGEINAMNFATENLFGYTLYTFPFMPCSVCAGTIIQRGIKRVVAPEATADQKTRWADAFALTEMLFNEAGVALKLYESI